MIFTSRMVYLTAVTLQSYSDAVAGELLRLGLLHFVDITEVEPSLTRSGQTPFVPREPNASVEKSAEARRRIEAILSIGGIGRPLVGPDEVRSGAVVDASEAIDMADSIGTQIDRTREKQRALQQQINRLEDVRRHLYTDGVGSTKAVAGIGQGGSFLEIKTGTIPKDRRESLEQKLALFPTVMTAVGGRDDRLLVVVAAMKRNGTEVGEILAAHGFAEERISADTGEETLGTLETRLTALREEQKEYAESIPVLVGKERSRLEQTWRVMRVQELLGTIEESFARTRRVVIASGWLPQSERDRVASALTEVTEGHIYVEWHEDREFLKAATGTEKHSETKAPAIAIPSRLENPRFLQPFQTLVTNFGMPAYGTIDPTGLVAIAYLVMFGLMFGDVGHGLVLVAVGVAGRLWTRRQPPGKEAGGIAAAIPLLSRLMIWSGASAIVTGVLFGSYFGFAWLPPLWFDYHGVVAGHVHAGPVESIFDVLTITLYFGIVVIATGLLINWANLLRQRRWFPLIFDKAGILGGTMYGAGIVVAARFASSGFRELSLGPVLLALIVGPAIVLFLKGPLEGHSRNPLWWLMEWVIELLEVFSGYLANTLSFMRVAGLGIAHVTLMIAFYQIAEMASPVGLNAVAIVILVFGNALVIVLEGLSAGIQSLRLNYYEFFSKHFQPSGVAYKPVSLEVS